MSIGLKPVLMGENGQKCVKIRWKLKKPAAKLKKPAG
jgi:hypothetical protein